MNNKGSFLHSVKALLRSFTLYQKCYVAIVFLITALFVIFMPDMMLDDTSNLFVTACAVISVLANPVCEILISKQSKMNFLVDIFFIEVPELVICIANGWYVVAATTMLFWVPVDVASYIRWTKHRDEMKEELTIVKRLSWKQDILVVAAIFAFAFAAAEVFGRLPDASDSFIDALASGFGMANGILLLMRYSEQWYAWLITLILYAVMYIQGGAYIMMISVTAMFINTCYGFVKWLLYTKRRERLGGAA